MENKNRSDEKMIKNKMAGWIIGGMITASALGITFGINSVGSAEVKAGQESAATGMMNGQMNSEMMNSSDMQKDCQKAMSSSEMQQAMKVMMKQPQMQTMMKQMLVSDPEFKQIMSDLINGPADGNPANGQ